MPCIRCGNVNVRCEGGGSHGFYRWLCIGTAGCKANYQQSRGAPYEVRPCWVRAQLLPEDHHCFSASLDLVVKDVVTGKAKCTPVIWTPENHSKYFKQRTAVVVCLLFLYKTASKTWQGLPFDVLQYIIQLAFESQMTDVHYKCHRCQKFNTLYMGKDKSFDTSAWWWCRDCSCYCHGRNVKG